MAEKQSDIIEKIDNSGINKIVVDTFNKILTDKLKSVFQGLQSPRIFFIYAHDGSKKDDLKADARIAQELIRWLQQVGLNIYSDRSPHGNHTDEPKPQDVTDVLWSQLKILPKVSQNVDYVILCCSELLGKFSNEEKSKDFFNKVFAALNRQRSFEPKQIKNLVQAQINNFSDYLDTLPTETFHHVLTELAFLHYRLITDEEKYQPSMIAMKFNENDQKIWPEFINPTDIWISDIKHRGNREWYISEDHAKHKAFFELLKRLFNGDNEKLKIIDNLFDFHSNLIEAIKTGKLSKGFSDVLKRKSISDNQSRYTEFEKKLLLLHGINQEQDFVSTEDNFGVPILNINFYDRKKQLKDLYKDFFQNEKNIKFNIIKQCIKGSPGIGKTQLAIKYIEENKKYYNDIHWFSAEDDMTGSRFDAEYRKFAQRLHIYHETNITDEVIKLVNKRLDEEKVILLVFDNVISKESIEKYIPINLNKAKLHILITSYDALVELSMHSLLELKDFEMDDAVEFVNNFFERTKNFVSRDCARDLVITLSSYPLALSQAVSYIYTDSLLKSTVGNIDLYVKNYIKEYNSGSNKTRLLNYPQIKNDNYTKTTYITWGISRDTIKKLQFGNEANEILDICAYLDPDYIPRFIFSSDILEYCLDKIKSKEGLALLTKFSLIGATKYPKCVHVHRLLQEIIRLHHGYYDFTPQPNKFQEMISKVIKLINKKWKFDRYKLDTWEKTELLLPHVITIKKFTEEKGIVCQEYIDLLIAFSFYQIHVQAHYEIAIKFLENALDKNTQLNNKKLSDEDKVKRNKALIFKYIAISKAGLGEYDDAKILLLNALNIDKNLSQKNFSYDQAKTLDYLGDYCDNTNQHYQQVIFYWTSLAIKVVLGGFIDNIENKEKIIQQINNFFSTDIFNLKLDTNEDYIDYLWNILCQAVLSIENVEDSEIALSLCELGNAFGYIGRFKEQLKLLLKVKEIEKKIYKNSPDHPELGATYHEIGCAYENLKKYEKQRCALQKALNIKKEVYKDRIKGTTFKYPPHPEVASTLRKLATANFLLGNTESECSILFEDAIQIYKQVHGDKHINVALTLYDFAKIKISFNHINEAIPKCEEAYKIINKIKTEEAKKLKDEIKNLLEECKIQFGSVDHSLVYSGSVTEHRNSTLSNVSIKDLLRIFKDRFKSEDYKLSSSDSETESESDTPSDKNIISYSS